MQSDERESVKCQVAAEPTEASCLGRWFNGCVVSDAPFTLAWGVGGQAAQSHQTRRKVSGGRRHKANR